MSFVPFNSLISFFIQICDDLHSAYEPGPSADMDFIASVLKISTKYDVPHLRKQFVTALTPYFPSTLLDFDEAPEMPGESLDHVTAQLFRITNICKECDLPVLLPVAYFWICEVDMEKLLDGVKPEEEDSPITLTPANLRSVLLARDGLQHRTRQRNFSFIFDRSKSIHEGGIGLEATCTSPDRCNQFRESFIRPFFEADYLKPLSKIFGSGVYLGFSLCDYCSEKTLTCTEEERAALWEDLPSIFGLADWETLAQETSSSHLHVRRSVLNIEPRAAFWY